MFRRILLVVYCALLGSVLSGGRYEMPFGCRGKRIDDRTRQGVLNLINGIRTSVALGDFMAMNNLPSASDMVKLSWDCALETMARDAVRGCRRYPRVMLPNGINYRFFDKGTPTYTFKYPLESAVIDWAEISTVIWPRDNVFDGNPAYREFVQMIHSNTTSVGCYQAICKNRATAACVFSVPDIYPGTLVYTSGNPCHADDNCKQFAPAYCDIGLCVNADRPSTTPPPTTTTTITTTTTTSPTTTTTTTSLTTTTTTTSLTTTTTTRRKSTDCPSPAFSSHFRETALGAHNNFRSKVATGKERNAEHPGELAPPSSRMDLLAYDCTAEEYARRHVLYCDKRESPIHLVMKKTFISSQQLKLPIWELFKIGIPSNMDYTIQLAQRVDRPVTSVSKILWGNNRHVGCATHKCLGFYFTSCMYKAPVNVIGEKIYAIGGVCDSCPHGPSNCDKTVGLCFW